MTVNISNEDFIKAMLALYQDVNSEITRYRDYEWKLPIWTAALLAAIVGVANQIDSLGFDFGKKYILKTVLASFSVAATAFACWYIYFLHSKLIENRKIRRLISNCFQFSDEGIYAEYALLPEKYKTEIPKFANGITHTIASWLFVIFVLAYNLLFIFSK